jgi:YVTN family beta-propeller protein
MLYVQERIENTIHYVQTLPVRIRWCLLLMCSLVVFAGCSPDEPLLNEGASTQWQVFVASNTQSQRTISAVELPTNRVLVANILSSTLGSVAIDGDISKIILFRGNLYVFIPTRQRIEVIADSNYRRIATLDFSAQNRTPRDIAFGNATTGYIACEGGNRLSILDVTNFRLAGEVVVGNNPVDVDVQENTLFVANRSDNTVSFVDTRTNTVIQTLSVPSSPVFLQPDVDQATLLVVSAGGGKFDTQPRTTPRLTYIDMNRRQVLSSVGFTDNMQDSTTTIPQGLVVTTRQFAFILTPRAIIRVDTRSRVLVRIVQQRTATSIAYNPVRDEIMLADAQTSTITLCDNTDATSTATFRLPFPPSIVISR